MLKESSELTAPIYQEDIDDIREDTEALWKSIYRTIQRLHAQKAPPALVKEVEMINNLYENICTRYKGIREYFPLRGKD